MEKVLNIVIADDNTFLTDYMKKQIEIDNRYKVIGVANDDEQEIELIEKLKPDVVITDLLRGNEYTGLDIIKKYKDKENKPIFFVVSAGIYHMIKELRDNDIEYHLDKPFMYEQLLTILSNIYYRKYFSTDKHRKL